MHVGRYRNDLFLRRSNAMTDKYQVSEQTSFSEKDGLEGRSMLAILNDQRDVIRSIWNRWPGYRSKLAYFIGRYGRPEHIDVLQHKSKAMYKAMLGACTSGSREMYGAIYDAIRTTEMRIIGVDAIKWLSKIGFAAGWGANKDIACDLMTRFPRARWPVTYGAFLSGTDLSRKSSARGIAQVLQPDVKPWLHNGLSTESVYTPKAHRHEARVDLLKHLLKGVKRVPDDMINLAILSKHGEGEHCSAALDLVTEIWSAHTYAPPKFFRSILEAGLCTLYLIGSTQLIKSVRISDESFGDAMCMMTTGEKHYPGLDYVTKSWSIKINSVQGAEEIKLYPFIDVQTATKIVASLEQNWCILSKAVLNAPRNTIWQMRIWIAEKILLAMGCTAQDRYSSCAECKRLFDCHVMPVPDSSLCAVLPPGTMI